MVQVGGISRTTKYLNDKRYYYGAIPSFNRDVVVAGTDQWTKDPEVEYSCKWCHRILSKITDSSHQNPSLYCSFCRILSEIEEDTRKKSRVQVHKGKVTDPSISYAPEKTIGRKKNTPKGTFAEMRKRNINIVNYREHGWRREKEE